MKNFNIIIYQCLNYLGIDFSKIHLDINERIKCQKYCYLISSKYRFPNEATFNLYQYGPYNSYIADIVFDISNNIVLYSDASKEYNYIEKIPDLLILLDNIKSIFNCKEQNSINDLIVFATFIFIQENYPSASEQEQFKLLRSFVGYFVNSDTSLKKILKYKKLIY